MYKYLQRTPDRVRVRRKIFEFYVLLTVHLDTSVSWKPTWCTIYPQFISSINLYMFRAYL